MKDISDSQGMTVKEGTLLFNLELKEKKKKRLLKVVDHLNRRLSFFENERVFFSSKRLDLQMFVYEFARFLKFPITVQAMVPADIMDMLRDEATSPDMIIHMNSILQFRSCCEETTLVVNSDIANLRDIKTRMQFIMEVPVDLDIEVRSGAYHPPFSCLANSIYVCMCLVPTLYPPRTLPVPCTRPVPTQCPPCAFLFPVPTLYLPCALYPPCAFLNPPCTHPVPTLCRPVPTLYHPVACTHPQIPTSLGRCVGCRILQCVLSPTKLCLALYPFSLMYVCVALYPSSLMYV